MSTVVYTAIYGMRDRLIRPRCKESGVAYVCLTDAADISDEFWQVVRYDPGVEGQKRKAAWCKMIPSALPIVSATDRSVWVDATVRINGPITSVFNLFQQDIAVVTHPKRDTVSREANYCRRLGKDTKRNLQLTLSRVFRDNRDCNRPLPMGGILWRRHNESAERFGLRWFEIVEQGSRRNQLSLLCAAQETETSIRIFDRGFHRRYCSIHRHRFRGK